MLELAQVLDVRLFDVTHFLDSHFLSVQFAQKDGALRSAAHPLQVRYLLEGDLPRLCGQGGGGGKKDGRPSSL